MCEEGCSSINKEYFESFRMCVLSGTTGFIWFFVRLVVFRHNVLDKYACKYFSMHIEECASYNSTLSHVSSD